MVQTGLTGFLMVTTSISRPGVSLMILVRVEAFHTCTFNIVITLPGSVIFEAMVRGYEGA